MTNCTFANRKSTSVQVYCTPNPFDSVPICVRLERLTSDRTSIGANLHEAHGAQSRNDFISKISITQKEAIESVYWLRLMKEEFDIEAIGDLLNEANQLAKIFSSILISSTK